jgi:Hydroxymethylglutaryl-coenzyme A reductase
MMISMHLFLSIGIMLNWRAKVSAFVRPRKVHVSYPIDLLGTNSDSYSGNLTIDKLSCFGNRDYGVPTYRETMLCMIRLPMGHNCNSIWGSRSVVVEVTGSAEFLKLNRLPPGSVFNELISLNATRWLELTASSSSVYQREVRHVPAEPIYLCARSNDWTGSPAKFRITFRPVFLRERDKQLCHSKTLVHILLVIAVTSIWLLPYIAAIVVAALTFMHGIKFIIAIITFSCCIVSLTPLMLTKKNRHLARLYFNYFFTRIQAEETKMVFRQRMPVFQALFFSSALVCIGSGGSYIIYTYCGIDRELRNLLLKMTLGVASSWFVFFLCRSFERFCRDWVWVPMSVCLAQLLDLHLNPLSRDEVVASTLLISLGISLSFPRIARAARSKFPQGARAVAPLRVWANKVRVSLLSKTLTHYRKAQLSDSNSPVSEFVSMAFDEKYTDEYPIDSSDAATGGYGTPLGFEALNDDEEEEEEDLDVEKLFSIERDYGEGISRRRVESSKLHKPSYSGLEANTCLTDRPLPQLWESLLDPTVYMPAQSSSGMDISEVGSSGQSRPSRSDSVGSVSSRCAVRGAGELTRSSSSGLSNLFLCQPAGSKEEDESELVKEADAITLQKTGSFFFASTSPRARVAVASSASKLRKVDNEERNRLALSRALGVDLSVLRLSPRLDTSPPLQVYNSSERKNENAGDEGIVISAGATTEPTVVDSGRALKSDNNKSMKEVSSPLTPDFTHLVGAVSVPLSVLGPILLDGRQVWIPMACNDPSFVNNFQRHLTPLAGSHFLSCLFPATCEYHASSAHFKATTYADALFVQKWLVHPSNLSLLRSIAKGEDSTAPTNENDFILTASVKGKEVKLLLRILTGPSGNMDVDSNDDEAGHSTLTADQWNSVGLEAVKRVVLAALEDLNEVVGSVTLASVRGTDSESGVDQYSSTGFVGVECSLQPSVLKALGLATAEQLVAASEFLETSSVSTTTASNWKLLRASAAVLSSLGMESTHLHGVLERCNIEVCVVPSSSLDGSIRRIHATTPIRSDPNVLKTKCESISDNSSALLISLSMPIAIPCRLNDAHDTSVGPGIASPSPFPGGAADACYELLAGSASNHQLDTDVPHGCSASRALAAVLLAAHVSQLTEFIEGNFFNLLSAKR